MSKKSTNLVIVALILSAVVLIVGYGYTQNPEYIAKQNMSKAETAITQLRIGDAAKLLQKVSLSPTTLADSAKLRLQGLITSQILQSAPAGQAADAIDIIKVLPETPDLVALVWPIIESRKQAAPKDALSLLNAITSLSTDAEKTLNIRITILENLLQTEPDNKDVAIELAVLYEPKGDVSRLEALLTPHKKQLGISEGARILGQIYASQNRIQDSYDLLLPYTETKLTEFHNAENHYNELLNDIWQQTIVFLNAGNAPETFYSEYDHANKTRQDEMVQEIYAQRRDDSPEVATAFEAYRNAASIVPVALDMGMVMLRRAQTLEDEQQRTGTLEAAEKTFLAVKGVAGQSDEYRIYLAQVYYWLGKADEGKALFEELLTVKNRDFVTLYSVGSILRDLGANSEARNLIQEAYEKAKDNEEAYAAANYMSLLSSTLSERIEWLEKSNPDSPRVQADLNNLRGNEAEQNNNLPLAARYYQKTIDSYEKQEKNATTLNNVALVYFSLYRISGDQNALAKGINRLDEAITLAPSDSIILINAADVLISTACREVIGNKINLAKLRSSGNLHLLSFLYNTDEQKRTIARQLSQNTAMIKAVSYLENAMILAPKLDTPYLQLTSFYAFVEDHEAMKRVADKLKNVEIDTADASKRYEEYYSGSNDKYYTDIYNNRIQEYRELQKDINPRDDQYSHTVAVSYLINTLFSTMDLNKNVDLNELVQMAKNNYERFPSKATRRDYYNALLVRAVNTVQANDDTLAGLMEEYRRLLSHRHLVLVSLETSSQIKEILLQNEDMKNFMALIKEEITHNRTEAAASDWALMRHLEPEFADRVLANIKANPINLISLSISERLNPPNASIVYNQYWYKRMNGDTSAALQLLQDAAVKGVKLPLITS